MPDRAWKRWERTVAAHLGGTRTGPRGLGLPDAVGTLDGLAPEAKHGEARWFTARGRADIQQAITNARGAPWGLFVKDSAVRGSEGELVVLPMPYFVDLYKRANKKEEPNG